jgi:hypothetical protein
MKCGLEIIQADWAVCRETGTHGSLRGSYREVGSISSGLHGGLLHVTNITQIFHIFVFIVCILILQLTSFFPRKVWVKEHSSLKDLLFNNFIFYRTKIINKMGEHLKIIEYPKQICKILWDKLPNSGEFLKLLIPNLEKIFRGGWTNYSSMVTSQKMVLLLYFIRYNIYGMYFSGTLGIKNRKMDNRGSKSDSLISVKEQRVDGSWLLNLNVFNSLRCTLRGFERITLYGSLSYQILNKHLYSTTTIVTKEPKNIKSFIQKDGFKLNPWFVTGFTDGDGSFAVSITKKK